MIVLNHDSPETGWEPFLQWLRDHNVEPSLCRELEVGEGQNPRCVAHLYATDENGAKYVVGEGDDVRLAMQEPVEFVAVSQPPRRFQ